MKGQDKTKEQLIGELDKMRQQISTLKRQITKLKQANLENVRFRAISEKANYGISLVDSDGKYIYINKTFAEMYGCTKIEIINNHYSNLIADEDISIAAQERDRLLETHLPITKELRRKKKDGSVFSSLTKAIIIEDTSGELSFIATFVLDITEQKDMEEQQKKEKEFYEVILNAVSDSIYIFDPITGKPVMWNKAFNEITGYTDKEIMNKTGIVDWYQEEDINKLRNETDKITRGEKSLTEVSLITKDKGLVPTEYTASMTKDIEGNPQYIIAVGRDITERKKAEEESKSERDKLQAVVSGLARSGIGVDIVGLDYIVRFQNDILQEGFGNIIGKPCYENYMSLKQPCDFCPMVGAIRNNKMESVELTAADGRDYELLAAPLPNPDGTIDQAIEIVRDITERKQEEEKLKKSESRLTEAQRVAHIGSWDLDIVSNRLIWSDETYRLFGLEKRKFEETYETFLENIHPDDREMVDKAYTESVANKTPYDIVHRLMLKDGTVKYVNERCSTFYDDDGKPIRSVGTVQDITERKQAEEALKVSQEKFSRVFYSNPHPMSIITMEEGRYLDVNDSYVKTFGFPRKELFGRTTLEIGIVKTGEFRRRLLQILREKQAVKNLEIELYTKSGRMVNVLLSAGTMEIGSQTCMVSVLTDVTERKQAEEALRESEERYRKLVETSPSAVVVHIEGKIIFVNQAALELVGASSSDEMVGKSTFDFIHPDYIAMLKRRQGLIEQGKAQLREYLQLIRLDGNVIDVEATAALLTYQGKPAILSILNDVTERRKAEERLVSSERRFRSLFENAVDGMLLLHEDGSFIDCNIKAEEIYGQTRDAILSMKPWEISPLLQPDGRKSKEKALKLINAALRGSPQLFEWVHIREDGSYVDVEINLNRIEIEGKPEILTIVRDITERKQMEKILQEVREAERTRIAREMHDAVSQTLSSASLIAEVIPELWKRDRSEGQERLQEVVYLTRSAQDELRTLLYELNPLALTNKEPEELLHQLALTAERRISIPVKVEINGQYGFTPESKIALYRIAQEALNNAGKHSKAKQITINLTCQPKKVILKISDDGLGFDAANTIPKGFGLNNMNQRAKEIGASLIINSTVGNGTEIILTLG